MSDMKNYTNIVFAALALIVAFGACSKSTDDDDATVGDACYISAFTLGQMRRQIHYTTTAGKDTAYYVSYSGASFPMIIDHRRQTVELVDSLLEGTLLNTVLTTVTFTGALVHAPEADTTTWVTYNSTDSVDFTTPRIYRVYSTDGLSHRDYTVRLVVRRADPEAYAWTRSSEAMPDEDEPLAEWESSEEITTDYDIVASIVYAQANANLRVLLACRERDALTSAPLVIWSRLLGDDNDWVRFGPSDDNPYVLIAPYGLHIVRYDNRLIAFAEGSDTIYVSRDNGITWIPDDNLTYPDGLALVAADGTALPMKALVRDDTIWLAIGDATWLVRRNGFGE